jgi:hypothetical protein
LYEHDCNTAADRRGMWRAQARRGVMSVP